MSNSKLKDEIIKALDDVPEAALLKILVYIKRHQYHIDDKTKQLVAKIMAEDADLLKRLADS